MSSSNQRKKQKMRLVRLRIQYMLLALSIFTPLLFFLALGVDAWLEYDDRWLILLCLTLFSAASGLAYKYIFSSKRSAKVDITEEFEPSNKKSWGPQEEKIWQDSMVEAIRRIGLAPDIMDVLQRHPLAMADFVANKYSGRSKLEINPLEALVLVEEVSRRYRLLLQERFPFIEEITLQRAEQFYQVYNSDVVQSLKKYSPWVLNAYQALTNPAGKVFETVFGDIKGELLDQTVANLQLKLKQLFLFECVEVLMDLYSGRFLISNDSLEPSSELKQDKATLAEVLEPLRVVVIGQVSSGKSTLVNRLCGAIVAEVDILPTTDKRMVYEINLPSSVEIRLCDLPGIDNNIINTDQLFNEVLNSDLVIWCLKATQSAKSLDQQLSQRLDVYFADPKNVSLKPPKKLGVITHADLLVKYAIKNGLKPCEVLNNASEFNSKIVSVDVIESFSQDDEAAFTKIQSLIEIFLDESLQVQLNRRRKASSNPKFSKQIERLVKGSTEIAGLFK